MEGIPGGISTGANLLATVKYIKQHNLEGQNIATFAPSFAERYMSTLLFDEDNNNNDITI